MEEEFDLAKDPQTGTEELPDGQSGAVRLARSRRCKIRVLESVRAPHLLHAFNATEYSLPGSHSVDRDRLPHTQDGVRHPVVD